SRFRGSEISTSAAIGPSSRTHSRKAAITWASDQASLPVGTIGTVPGSGCEAEESLGHRGVAGNAASAVGEPDWSCCVVDGISCLPRDLRAKNWAGSADVPCAIGALACTIGTGRWGPAAGTNPGATPPDKSWSAAHPRTAAIDSLLDNFDNLFDTDLFDTDLFDTGSA